MGEAEIVLLGIWYDTQETYVQVAMNFNWGKEGCDHEKSANRIIKDSCAVFVGNGSNLINT